MSTGLAPSQSAFVTTQVEDSASVEYVPLMDDKKKVARKYASQHQDSEARGVG